MQIRRRIRSIYSLMILLFTVLCIFYILIHVVKTNRTVVNFVKTTKESSHFNHISQYQTGGQSSEKTAFESKSDLIQGIKINHQASHTELTTYKKRSNSLEEHGKLPLDIYVVEEHHEVIPYWLEAADNGTIPKSGNILIHIDGHSDMASPFNVPGYPFFRWPKKSELKYMMQGNDMFIQASVIAGLVDRVIWVWPEWDKPNHEADYVVNTLSLGLKWETYGKTRDFTENEFCMCKKNETYVECRSFTVIKSAEMFFQNDTFNGKSVSERDCHIKRSVTFEELSEQTAEVYIDSPTWLHEKENVILDLDLDYYGCSYAIGPLLKANVTVTDIQRINQIIQVLMCPKNSMQEQESDTFLSKIISFIYTTRLCSEMSETDRASLKCDVNIKLAHEFFSKTFQKSSREVKIQLCSSTYNLYAVVSTLVTKFKKLNIDQLKSLFVVGFCFNTSIKTFSMYQNQTFGICVGANTPDATAVYEHTPTDSELIDRTRQLKRLIGGFKKYFPKLVTISRSMRDGYTPRNYFKHIEGDMIDILNGTWNNDVIVHYDTDLLGGQQGWSYRHDPAAILNVWHK